MSSHLAFAQMVRVTHKDGGHSEEVRQRQIRHETMLGLIRPTWLPYETEATTLLAATKRKRNGTGSGVEAGDVPLYQRDLLPSNLLPMLAMPHRS
jgi:hypothetical protein